MERVSTFGNYQTLLKLSVQLQADLAQQQIKVSSGELTDDYSEIAGDSQLVLDLKSSLTMTDQYIKNADIVLPSVESSYSALTGVVDVMASYTSTLTSALGVENTDISTLNQTSQAALNEIASLLNTSVTGVYLFGGTVTDSPPVDINNPPYTPQIYPSTANTDYYTGNDVIHTFQADDDYEISYGIVGNDAAFEKTIRAMSMIANLGAYDSDAIVEAYDLLNEATEEISNLQTTTSLAASSIDSTADAHLDTQLFAESLLGDLTTVDVAEATAELNLLQTQLEASYSTVANATKLSLLNYL